MLGRSRYREALVDECDRAAEPLARSTAAAHGSSCTASLGDQEREPRVGRSALRFQPCRSSRQRITAQLGCRRDGVCEQRGRERRRGLLGERGALEEDVDRALLVARVERDAAGSPEQLRAGVGIDAGVGETLVDECLSDGRSSGEQSRVGCRREQAGPIGSGPRQPRRPLEAGRGGLVPAAVPSARGRGSERSCRDRIRPDSRRGQVPGPTIVVDVRVGGRESCVSPPPFGRCRGVVDR